MANNSSFYELFRNLILNSFEFTFIKYSLGIIFSFFEFIFVIPAASTGASLIITVIIIPLCFLLVGFFLDSKNELFIKKYTLFCTIFTFLSSLVLWYRFDYAKIGFQHVFELPWFLLNGLEMNFIVGIDGVGLMFFLLTTFLMPICVLISWNSVTFRIKEYYLLLLLIEYLLLNVFVVLDLVFFYIFFESVLIPMFILIIVWGSRERKIHAAFQFFLYTLIGSVLMLLGILTIINYLGSSDIRILLTTNFSKNLELILWLCFFFPFAVKMPMFPFHIWLPEAHVEAPTAGSVLLAGILLKLGTYGVLRILLPSFPYANGYFTPLVFTFAILGIIYSSLATIRQIDLKKIIAYSSVAHMNFILIGLFSVDPIAISGSIYLMLSHGLVSSGLFICVGILYDRYHTRLLEYYGGLVNYMPLFSSFFLFLSLANIGFPLTSSFVGELLIMVGAFKFNAFAAILSGIGMITGACYAMWLYNRVVFGELKLKHLTKFSDLNFVEFLALFIICLFTLITGIYVNPILKTFELYSLSCVV